MDEIPDNQIAEFLDAILVAAAREAMEDTAVEIVQGARVDLPKGDPADDPNPLLELRDSFATEWREPITEDRGTLIVSAVSPYAIKQHESYYLKHPRGGGPKYLEKQLLEAAARLEAKLGIKVRARLRSRNPATTRNAAEAKAAFAAAGIHSLDDYVNKVMGSYTLPGHQTKSKKK